MGAGETRKQRTCIGSKGLFGYAVSDRLVVCEAVFAV